MDQSDALDNEAAAKAAPPQTKKRRVEEVTRPSIALTLFGRPLKHGTMNVVSWLPKAPVWHGTKIFPRSLKDQWLTAIRQQAVPLAEPTYVKMPGSQKTFEERRRVFGVGNEGVRYFYAFREVECIPWSKIPALLEVRDAAMVEVQKVLPDLKDPPNFCLLNWYRSGQDCIGSHADQRDSLQRDKPIVSVSLGAARRFVFHSFDKPAKKMGEVLLHSGDVCIMGVGCQEHYKHSIPKMAKVKDERWSLTFRWALES
jgi:alkylated DNA repair dioxygenase AlkB